MRCTWNVVSSCIEDSGVMTLNASTCTLHSLTDRIEVHMTDHPRSKVQWGSICLRLSAKTEHPKYYFKSVTVDESQQFHPSTPTHRAVGKGVVLIEVCLDEISSQRVAKKFLSSLPQPDHWLPWYYSWRKQSLWDQVSSCWVTWVFEKLIRSALRGLMKKFVTRSDRRRVRKRSKIALPWPFSVTLQRKGWLTY